MGDTRYIFYAAACLSLAATALSCSKEAGSEAGRDASSTGFEECSMIAQAGRATKTHISGTTGTESTVIWDEGNDLSVFSADKSAPVNNRFTIGKISAGSAIFSGEIESLTESLYALYPYTKGASYADGTISGAAIPTTQTASANSFADGAALALAHGTRTPGSDCTSLDFSNLCAVLSFTLPENIDFADEITISSKSGANIAGTVTIDCPSSAIVSASASSVTLNGSFTGGDNYMVTVAPGTYTDGFNFLIKTEGGNGYTRSTSKTATLKAGKIYPLGKLSLEIPSSYFSPKVVVTHNVSDNTLTGSTAVFSMTSNAPDEFDGAIKSILTTVNVTKGGKTIRSCAASGKNVGETAMTQGEGCPYVPDGCTYKATIIYTIDNGEKDVARTITKDCDVVWSAPTGFAITATPTGYTSYSCYTGADGQTTSVTNANNCDPATIYNVGSTFTGGLTSDVKTQAESEGIFAITTTIDDAAQSGNVGSQSWAAHTIKSASWKFDGVTGTCSNSDKSKTVYVTGLPYNKDNAYVYNYRRDDWSWTDHGSWEDNEYLNWYLATVNFRGFYIPSNITAQVNYSFENYSGSSFHTYLKCYAGGTQFLDVDNQATSKWYDYNGTANVTFTSANNSITCVNSAKSSWASGAVATSRLYKMQVLYL